MTRVRPRAATVLAALLVCAVACGPTTYPADVFPEMHYQPSYRRLEPDRAAPPPDAVPVTGSTPRMSFDDAAGLTNPLQPTQQNVQDAAQLARVNCSACHGVDGHGQGPVASYFSPVKPVDFTSDRVRSRTDGQLFWIIANGLGNMPAFRSLLSEHDLWAVVLFVRQTQQSQ